MNHSFWLRAALLFTVAVVPMLLFVGFTVPDTTNLQEIARRTADELDRLIQLRQQQVFTISAFPSIRAFAASTPETRSQRAAVALSELQALVASDTNVREAFITDTQGIVTMATREGWNADLNDRRFVQDALSGLLVVSPIARDRGEFSTYYASPILDNDKEIAGALVIRVAAQEMWSVTPRGEDWYAVISDENGVRLDDSGDPARRLSSFAPLDTDLASKVVSEQTYGAELPLLRATDLPRAQELLERGVLDQLRPADFNVGSIATQRLISNAWVVLALAPEPSLTARFAPLALALLTALVLALGGALLLSRI
jgi:C4-dicarboxylate-specific signal transduction histidine kinase